jgi:hypothetical protein
MLFSWNHLFTKRWVSLKPDMVAKTITIIPKNKESHYSLATFSFSYES